MCGLAGTINLPLPTREILDVMGHRGPDENSFWQKDNVNFFHLRLSIVDIACGKQPMHLGDRFTIVFNGEIYNHLELRKQFNLKCSTGSDTETLLMFYERLGHEMLHHLDGMFVIVIHDNLKKELFVARDRAGKKPLYYYLDKNQFAFASELNGIGKIVQPRVSHKHIFQYLRLGSFYRNNTPYENIHELEGGTYITVNTETLAFQKNTWWDIFKYYHQNTKIPFHDANAAVDRYLHTAVKRRIESSDLEVGCFLSGGIDSGLVTAIASEYNSKVKTFTVSFNGEYNEAPLAKLVADQYGTQHTEIRISFDNLVTDIEKILLNYGEPFFDSSAIPSFYVSREAKKHVTVILNGDGADELFGGYRRYVPFARYDFFKPSRSVRWSATILKRLLPMSHNRKSLYNYAYRLASLASKRDFEIYLSAGVDIFEDYESTFLWRDGDYLPTIRDDFEKISKSNLSGLKKIMNLDFTTNLFDDLLVKMDIATMAHSLEGRSPFMAKELLEFLPSLPDDFKIRNQTTKYLLRNLAKQYLPAELINQPKRGFEIPLKHWVDHQLKDIISSYLQSSNSFHREFVKEKFVTALLNKKARVPAEKRAKMLWTLFSLEVWYQQNRNLWRC